MRINNTEVEFKKSFAIQENVDLVFNSASGLLFMRTGTAKNIREYSEKLSGKMLKEYFDILNNFSSPVIKKYISDFGVKDWEPRRAQLSAFHKILENGGEYDTGQIVLDKGWSDIHTKDILNIIGMTYHFEKGELDVDKVTEESLTEVLIKGFLFADKIQYLSISIPVLCTRGDYGLEPKVSVNAIIKALQKSQVENIKKVVICFESEGPREKYEEIISEIR